MCRHIAPVGHVMYDEAVTPHGIALTVASQRRGLIDWNDETVGIVYAEPDGGNCQAHCVTSQPLPAAIAAIRAELTYGNLAPAAVYETHERLIEHHSPFGKNPVDAATDKGDTALFVGDEAPYLWPSMIDAVKTLLESAAVNPVELGRRRSNGHLASSLGFPDTARAQAQSILDELKQTGASRLLVMTPGDLYAFRYLYNERLGLAWPDQVELTDLATFLTDCTAQGTLAFDTVTDNRAYAYVDPTHAVRAPERFDAVRSLAQAVLGRPPIELFWRRERAHPVGSTHVQFSRPDIADRLTLARLEDARQVGAEALICEDPGTLHHLSQHADLPVYGLYELLAEHVKS
jgi:Fe-S oxidoreductase